MDKENYLINDLYSSFLAEISQGLAIADRDGRLELCNPFFARLFQMEMELLAGRKIGELFPGAENCLPGMVYKDVVHGRKIKLKAVSLGAAAKGGHLLLIAEEESAPEKEHFLNQAFRTVLDNVDEGVLIVDGANRIVYCNKVQLQFDGFSLADIAGRYTWEVYHFNQEISTLRKCIETGQQLGTYVHYYISNNGQYVRVTGNNYPLRDGEQTVGAVAVYRNLQKSEELVDKIVDLQKRLQEDRTDEDIALISGAGPMKRFFTFGDILGDSQLIRECIHLAKSAVQSDSPVFICGETGTGKEMFAQSIHHAGRRGRQAMISINCAAIPENLLEGIIFGTVRGVFTGAADRKGLFEEADGGTLFLDEINSMPLFLQSKLLRALEEKKIRRLGGQHEIPIDVRIISSCNADPREAIQRQELRSDLYYRLAVIPIEIPPLRARKEDIRVLAEYFVRGFNSRFQKNICEIDPCIFAKLESYDWPGNVRQLKHCLEAAMNLVPEDEPLFSEKYLPHRYNNFFGAVADGPGEGKEVMPSYEEERERETRRICTALKRHRGNISRSAQELGISRQVLYYRLEKLGIRKDGSLAGTRNGM